MQNASSIKSLLESHGLRPNKTLGQNFLVEPAHIARLVDASGAGKNDLVLEVGPGTGALTDLLLERGATVIACELDRGLAGLLRDRYDDQLNSGQFRLIVGDCLEGKHAINAEIIEALAGRPFRLVANLPYQAASPLMILLATRHHPSLGRPTCLGQFVTIQREVADRLRAAPGSREFGEMGALVQATSEVRRIALLPPGCFWPPPKITSEMVSIIPLAKPMTTDIESLSKICRILFTHRRKQLGSILARETTIALDALPAAIDPTRRPEQLSIQELIMLARLLPPDAQAPSG